MAFGTRAANQVHITWRIARRFSHRPDRAREVAYARMATRCIRT